MVDANTFTVPIGKCLEVDAAITGQHPHGGPRIISRKKRRACQEEAFKLGFAPDVKLDRRVLVLKELPQLSGIDVLGSDQYQMG
jgi:hypothetical protein